MKRERLLSNLVKIRESQLRDELVELKARVGKLAAVSTLGDHARSAACDTLAQPNNLTDLGVIGAMRLECIKLANEISRQLRGLSTRIGHSRKLADAAQEARDDLRCAVNAERERSQEIELEHFFAWKNNFKAGR
jgi:hypothetical protein